MLDLARIPGLKQGYCQDIACENPNEPDLVSHVTYINTNKSSAWICQDCLEQWMDTLEDYCANMVDLNLPDAYPFIP